MIVRLSFPHPSLFPNRKNGQHWGKTAAEKAQAREFARLATLQQRGDYKAPEGDIALSLLYLTPDGRHRDCDNMLQASKPQIDGIADALGINDRRFRPILVDWVRGPPGGGLIAAVGVSIVSGVSLDVRGA